MTDPHAGIAAHYSPQGLYETILAALKQAGKDMERLTPDDLAPVDEFHTRGHAVTVEIGRASCRERVYGPV